VGLFHREPPRRDAPPAGPPGQAEVDQLRAGLAALHREVLAAGAKLPDGAVPQFRRIEDALTGVLTHAGTLEGSPEEMFLVKAIVSDYLPTSVRAYLALPASLALARRTPASQDAADELCRQLEILEDRATELADAVSVGDVQALKNQSRFLESRFAQSSLVIDH
jgi:hypothetical protein